MGTMPEVTRGGEDVGFSKKKSELYSEEEETGQCLAQGEGNGKPLL